MLTSPGRGGELYSKISPTPPPQLPSACIRALDPESGSGIHDPALLGES